MDKGDALPGHIVLRAAIAEDTHTLPAQRGGGGLHHVDAERKVMDATLGIAFEEFGDRRVRARRLHQFDFGVTEVDIDEAHALLRIGVRLADVEAVDLAQPARRRGEIGHDDGDVTERREHRNPLSRHARA